MNATATQGLPYALVEDNGGILTLFVFADADRQTAACAYTGLEHEDPETVAQILRDLAAGENSLDGNADDESVIDDPQAAWDEVDSGAVVADNERLYPTSMGIAAQDALRLPLYAAALEEVRNWDGKCIFDLESLFFKARRLAPKTDGKPDTHELDDIALTLARLDKDNAWPDWPTLIAIDEDGGFLVWGEEDWLCAGYLRGADHAA